MSSPVLVINAGSSSIKYQLVDAVSADVLASGIVEKITTGLPAIVTHEVDDVKYKPEGELVLDNHEDGMAAILDMFAKHGPDLAAAGLVAVGHRVVQGGELFTEPTLITDEVEAGIESLNDLAPLHNPANLEGIRVARRIFPELPHVAVFDTAFHSTLGPEAYTYAIPTDIAKEYSIRRYGMHGTSHSYVSRRAAALLGKAPEDVNVIVLHIGNGASVTAVRGGKSVETSMGLTPLEGLVMGTRSGDIDPAIVFHLQRVAHMEVGEIDTLLNKKSGLLGMTGYSDARDLHDGVARGEERAITGLAVFNHRIKHYIGAYYALLGNIDAIAFTAGIGENDDIVRLGSTLGLQGLGIDVDPALNEGRIKVEKEISTADSKVKVFVIPTAEELEIARQAVALIS